VDLLVRGICCLRPGMKGVSDNIQVISIVGRFLEHSRVFWFANDGNPELYLSSADLMGRNLDRRVELLFPVEDPFLAEGVKHEVLDTALLDSVRARLLHADGTYSRVVPQTGQDLVESQTLTLRTRTDQWERKGGGVMPQVVLRKPPQG